MPSVKGKKMVVLINGVDISIYCDSNDHKKKAIIQTNTGYGKNAVTKAGTLLDGNGNLGGVYDSSAVAGPRAILNPLVAETVVYIRRPEGTGAGLPQDMVNVVVGEYSESAPVADFVRWTCALEYSDEINSTPQ